jgi:hypothetical protein
MNRQQILQHLVREYQLDPEAAKAFSGFLNSYRELPDEAFFRKFHETYPWLEIIHVTTQNNLLRKISGRIRWLTIVTAVGVAAMVTLAGVVLCLLW